MPSIETLEKFARALEVSMYPHFYEGEKPRRLPNLPKRKTANGKMGGSSGKPAPLLVKFRRLFHRMEESDRKVLVFMAQKMARRKAG